LKTKTTIEVKLTCQSGTKGCLPDGQGYAGEAEQTGRHIQRWLIRWMQQQMAILHGRSGTSDIAQVRQAEGRTNDPPGFGGQKRQTIPWKHPGSLTKALLHGCMPGNGFVDQVTGFLSAHIGHNLRLVRSRKMGKPL
jgi:hypothetical protein